MRMVALVAAQAPAVPLCQPRVASTSQAIIGQKTAFTVSPRQRGQSVADLVSLRWALAPRAVQAGNSILFHSDSV